MTVTLDEYARKIAGELRRVHDSKDLAAVHPVFAEADKVLAESKISEDDQRVFWGDVRKSLLSSALLLERQSNSALMALMQAIQQEIAAREKKKP